MVRKAKASAGLPAFGERKQETLIELQDNRTHKQIQQQQMQDEQNLRMLEEQEASIRQLEVNYYSSQKNNSSLIRHKKKLITKFFLNFRATSVT